MSSTHIAGWPERVPPPGVAGWEQAAVGWLLDQCPSDFRSYRGWVRHPGALAWMTVVVLQAQTDGLRAAWRRARVELGELTGPEALPGVLAHLESEGLRLKSAQRSANLLLEALQGRVPTPKL